ncbi:MAG: hypothetical protein NT074_00045 [Methanomicrobiales archaeon]|nr:hypothetical protein [Methanomicrobiales archaeon]
MQESLFSTSEIRYAILVAIIIGVIVLAAFQIIESRSNRFTQIYLVPGSFENYPSGSTTTFTYGIHSFEKEPMEYNVDFSVGSTYMGSKTFRLDPGGIHLEVERIDLAAIGSLRPLKVTVRARTPLQDYEVHYWIRNRTLLEGLIPVIDETV